MKRSHVKPPRTRAPSGQPEQIKTIGAKVPVSLFKKCHRRGGSAWLRRLMQTVP